MCCMLSAKIVKTHIRRIFKCFEGKLMEKVEEKVEDWDSLLSVQDRPNTFPRIAASSRLVQKPALSARSHEN